MHYMEDINVYHLLVEDGCSRTRQIIRNRATATLQE